MIDHGNVTGTSLRRASSAIVVTHQDGLRFAAQIRSHTLVLDQPERGGGQDAGPSPVELLGASLGSCVALYVHKFLAARHLPTDSLRVEVAQHGAQDPHRIGVFELRIILSDEIPAFYRPMIEAVARVCPAHNTLAHGADVRVAVEFPALAGECTSRPRSGGAAAST